MDDPFDDDLIESTQDQQVKDLEAIYTAACPLPVTRWSRFGIYWCTVFLLFDLQALIRRYDTMASWDRWMLAVSALIQALCALAWFRSRRLQRELNADLSDIREQTLVYLKAVSPTHPLVPEHLEEEPSHE